MWTASYCGYFVYEFSINDQWTQKNLHSGNYVHLHTSSLSDSISSGERNIITKSLLLFLYKYAFSRNEKDIEIFKPSFSAFLEMYPL